MEALLSRWNVLRQCIATHIAMQHPGVCSVLSRLLLTPSTGLCPCVHRLSGQHLTQPSGLCSCINHPPH